MAHIRTCKERLKTRTAISSPGKRGGLTSIVSYEDSRRRTLILTVDRLLAQGRVPHDEGESSWWLLVN